MAALGNAMWTVLIVAEERKFNRSYEFSQNTSLNEIMNTWTEECGRSGYWVFISPDRQDDYLDFMTLEMVGETILNSGIVNLRVKQLDEPEPRPTFEIFGHVNNECHYIEVEPQQCLYEVLRCLPGRPRELEHNGTLLNLKETVDEAGLKNNDVVQECCRQISVSVKLSDGETLIFQVAENSFVLHLFEKVKKYETGDFSLIHQGRYLHMQDRVRDLKQVVEVRMAKFTVDIDGRRISWTTRSEPITYPEFISQLSFHGQFGNEELEMRTFSCIGCRRCISEDIQLLPIQCCRKRSITLTATPQSNTRTLEDIQKVLISIESILKQIHQGSETKLQPGVRRALCKDLYETLEESGLIYNGIIKFVVKIKKHMERVEDEMNKIQTENESLKANKVAFQKKFNALRSKNATLETEGTALKAKKDDLQANIQAFEKVVRCLHENTGVKLLVWYDRNKFSPVVSRPEIHLQGKYWWAEDRFHIKCVIPELQPGWRTFEEVRDALQPLFSDNIIRMIAQLRSSIKGEEVARVTCLADDEASHYQKHTECCDENGRHVKWEETDKWKESQTIREGGRVLICGGQRRTALGIWHS